MFSNRLVREITFVLLLKLAFIYGLWFLFFRAPTQPPLSAEAVGQALLNPGTVPATLKP